MGRQHEEVLGVATHGREHVIEREQPFEDHGILLHRLEVIDEFELAVDERLIAATEADQHVRERLGATT